MPSISTEVPHQLGQEQATARLKGFLDKVRQHYRDQVSDLQGNWSGNMLDFTLTTYGFKIDGKLTVEECLARLEANLPFAALAFRGKIERTIAGELERVLS